MSLVRILKTNERNRNTFNFIFFGSRYINVTPHSQVLYPNVFEYRRRRKRETPSERRARVATAPNTARTTNRATADILRSVTKKRIDRADD